MGRKGNFNDLNLQLTAVHDSHNNRTNSGIELYANTIQQFVTMVRTLTQSTDLLNNIHLPAFNYNYWTLLHTR
jgi:hypothetical protein